MNKQKKRILTLRAIYEGITEEFDHLDEFRKPMIA